MKIVQIMKFVFKENPHLMFENKIFYVEFNFAHEKYKCQSDKCHIKGLSSLEYIAVKTIKQTCYRIAYRY